MRLAAALIGLLLLGPTAGRAEPATDAEAVRHHVQAGQWKKAHRALDRWLLDTVKAGGAMDGQDLVRAVRYRAVIEAGKGHSESSRWWWHAGLNLQAEGAEAWLRYLPEAAAAELGGMTVRPLEPKKAPPKFRQGPERLEGDPIEEGSKKIFSPASRRFRGAVELQIKFGRKNEFKEPLLIAVEGVPTVCVYAALDYADSTRFPATWRAGREVAGYRVVFSGWGANPGR